MEMRAGSWSSKVWDFITDIMTASNANTTICTCPELQIHQYSDLYNYVLIIFALPTLAIFGVCTNIINIFIYSRKRMRNSANTYLLFLACSDFLVILTGLFIFWIDSARSYIPELARAPYTTIYILPFGYMAQTCSIYFTVAAAVDCFVNVCVHQISACYCSVRNAKRICYVISLLSMLYNSLRFPQFNLRKCLHEKSQEMIIEICPTPLFDTINMIYNVYMYMVLMTLLPFLFLLILNVVIVAWQSISPKFLRPRAGSTLDKKPTVANKDDTITMIMVVVLFLACNTLALFVNVVESVIEDPDPLLLNYLTDTSNFLVIFNSSVNCLIYYIFNKEYRLLLRKHAGSAARVLKEEYFCCWITRAPYLPVSTIHEKVSQPSIEHIRSCVSHTQPLLEARSDSPVWQPRPLVHQRVGGIDNWEIGLNNPPDYEFNLNDADSGWDEQNSNLDLRFPAQRWLAEVKIVEGVTSQRPHIIVKPLSEHDALSVTAL